MRQARQGTPLPGRAPRARQPSLLCTRAPLPTHLLCAQGKPPRELRAGDYFGEEVVLSDAAQAPGATATPAATAATDCVLARITRESFTRNVGALQEIKQEHFNTKVLQAIPVLKDLTGIERRHIAKLMSRVCYPSGGAIVKPGGVLSQACPY